MVCQSSAVPTEGIGTVDSASKHLFFSTHCLHSGICILVVLVALVYKFLVFRTQLMSLVRDPWCPNFGNSQLSRIVLANPHLVGYPRCSPHLISRCLRCWQYEAAVLWCHLERPIAASGGFLKAEIDGEVSFLYREEVSEVTSKCQS